MKNNKNIVKKNELPLIVILFCVSLFTNTLYIKQFYGVFWPIVSGYDQFVLSTMTTWIDSDYLINPRNIITHPGFGIFLLPIYLINSCISFVVGGNSANFILAMILTIMYVLEGLFLKRILNDYLGLNYIYSTILALFFSFTSMGMLMSFTPDHFAFSQFFLILFVYLWTRERLGNKYLFLKFFTTLCIFSITITNGIKILLTTFIFEKKYFLKYLLCFIVILLSTTIISLLINDNKSTSNLGWAYYEKEYLQSVNYKHFYTSHEDIEGKCAIINSVNDNKFIQTSQKQKQELSNAMQEHNVIQTIKTFYWLFYKRWIGQSASIINVTIYNLFGESLLLHSHRLNKYEITYDSYSVIFLNIINISIIILFLSGVIIGFKTELMKLLLSLFSIDILIHIICGFGINEIYIYSPHYLFIITLAIGYACKSLLCNWNRISIFILLIITVTCFINNMYKIVLYLS